jgi:hypothetical protein
MPVNETLEYSEEIAEFRGELDGVVVNGLYPARFTEDEIDSLTGHSGPAVRAAVTEYCRYRSQVEELERLRGGMGDIPLASLSFLWPKLTGGFGTEINAGNYDELLAQVGPDVADHAVQVHYLREGAVPVHVPPHLGHNPVGKRLDLTEAGLEQIAVLQPLEGELRFEQPVRDGFRA